MRNVTEAIADAYIDSMSDAIGILFKKVPMNLFSVVPIKATDEALFNALSDEQKREYFERVLLGGNFNFELPTPDAPALIFTNFEQDGCISSGVIKLVTYVDTYVIGSLDVGVAILQGYNGSTWVDYTVTDYFDSAAVTEADLSSITKFRLKGKTTGGADVFSNELATSGTWWTSCP